MNNLRVRAIFHGIMFGSGVYASQRFGAETGTILIVGGILLGILLWLIILRWYIRAKQ